MTLIDHATAARLLRSARALWWACALLLAAAAPAHAVETVVLHGCAAVSLDGRTVEYARAPDTAEPQGPANAAGFRPLPGPQAGFGLGGGKLWLRFSVDATACPSPLYLALGNPFVNRVIAYRADVDGWRLLWDSDRPAHGLETARLRQQVVPLATAERGSFLVEVRGPGALAVAPELLVAGGLADRTWSRTTITGAMLGGIIALSLYLVCLAIILRFQGLLAFTASALSLGAFYAFTNGVTDPLLVAWSVDLASARDNALRLNGFAVLITACCHWLFVRGLLATAPERSTPRALLALPPLLAASAIPFLPGPVVSLICMATAAVAIGASVREVRRARRAGHPLANVTMIAFAMLSLGALAYVVGYTGAAPWRPWQLDLLAAGVWVEATMLSMAVGAHVKELRGREEALAARTEELSQLSRLDPLTGLGNRRAFDATAPAEVERCLRDDRKAGMLVIDIDHFKRVNDAWGHSFGDVVIRILGAAIATSVRATDSAYRYGGEEFVVLLPGLDAVDAHLVAERIMREFTLCSPTAPDGSRPFFSVSIGLATLRPGDTAATLFARADAAMYRGKQGGRCRIESDEHWSMDTRPVPTASGDRVEPAGEGAQRTGETARLAA